MKKVMIINLIILLYIILGISCSSKSEEENKTYTAKANKKHQVKLLISLFNDEDKKIRDKAVNRIVEDYKDESKSELLAAMKKGSDRKREYCIKTLGEVGDESVVPELFKYLEFYHPKIKIAAAETISKLATKKSIPLLVKAMKNKNATVRICLMKGFYNNPDEKVIPQLIKYLADPNYRVNKIASETLKKNGKPAVKLLTKELKKSDKNKERKKIEWIIFTLGKIGELKAFPNILELFNDKEFHDESFKALINIIELQKVPPSVKDIKSEVKKLKKIVEGENSPFCEDAMVVLSKLQVKEAIPTIKKKLSSKSIILKAEAILALRRLNSVKVVPELMEMLSIKSESIGISDTSMRTEMLEKVRRNVKLVGKTYENYLDKMILRICDVALIALIDLTKSKHDYIKPGNEKQWDELIEDWKKWWGKNKDDFYKKLKKGKKKED